MMQHIEYYCMLQAVTDGDYGDRFELLNLDIDSSEETDLEKHETKPETKPEPKPETKPIHPDTNLNVCIRSTICGSPKKSDKVYMPPAVYVKFSREQKAYLLYMYSIYPVIGRRDLNQDRINIIISRLRSIGYTNQVITRSSIMSWFKNERFRNKTGKLRKRRNR